MEKKSTGFEDFAIVAVWRNAYRILFWLISKDEEVTRMNNANLREKCGQLWLWKKTNLLQQWKTHTRKVASKIKRYYKENREKMTRKGYTIL